MIRFHGKVGWFQLVKKSKMEKTSELVESKARAQLSLAAELQATNQKLAQMRSAVVASGQAVPARWRTDKPKWHSLTKVSALFCFSPTTIFFGKLVKIL